jgi:glycine/D-amino acid oxidase-like deaminating enzyme
LVGQHRVHKNLYILNGLGSRGVLVAPTVAKNLIDFIE